MDEVIWTPLKGSQELVMDARANEILYCGTRGPGKCIPSRTPILTPNGWTTHGELTNWSSVYGSDGSIISVKKVFEKQTRPVYRISFNDQSTIECSDNHLWKVSIDRGFPKNWRIVDTLYLLDRFKNNLPCRLPIRPILQIPKKQIPIDPYMLGLWMGDGSASVRIRKPTGNRTKERKGYSVEFGSMDAELVDAAVKNGFSIRRKKDGFTWLLGKEVHKDALMLMDLFGCKSDTKFIPDCILLNDFETRLSFLQGLNDTDGTPTKSGSRIATCSKRLACDVVSLVRSLGGVARISEYLPSVCHRQVLKIYNVDFNFTEIIPFRLTRKIDKIVPADRLGWFNIKITNIEFIGDMEVSCIEVDSNDHLYSVGIDFIITHNTDAQLMFFRKYVGIGYGKFWRGVIFDREYKGLDDIISKSKHWFNQFGDGAKFNASKDSYKWVWPTGEELMFRVLKRNDDYDKVHGQEFAFIGFNEITKQPTPDIYEKVISCNRTSFTPEKDGPDLPNIPLVIFSTCNPWGPGRVWVKRKFIDCAEYGQIVKNNYDVFNPRTQKQEIITRTQVALFGSYKENIYLDPLYVASLEANKDENLKSAWLKGDWNAVCGSAIDDVWNKSVHVVRRFIVPSNWRIDRSFDWGSTHPFSVGWWAEANGEEVKMLDGTTWCPQKGSLIQIAEWYGSKEIGTNKGLKLSPSDIAKGIVWREKEWLQNGWIKSQPYAGPADNQIGNTLQVDVESIAVQMARYGVRWLESDKSSGSRTRGLQVLRGRLKAALDGEGPGIYFMDNCRASISTIPELPYDPDKNDDIDTTSEDHAYDMVRYRSTMGNNRTARIINIKQIS